jgi:hypothetical protein
MAKNNKGKVIQMLSPENYIRKKARTLPIFECLVRSDWEEAKMTTVLVARNHINGNITVCTYLVDLMCLGVKDSMYLFNVPIHKYEEFKDKLLGKMEMTEIDYPLAHNIVFAGVEFAEEYGFKPHKDYESVTKFMLEEDTDDIELIEIECGQDSKPLYIQGPFEDEAKARKIMAQLERTAGKGNYDFMIGGNDEFDEFDEEDEPEEEDEFKHLNHQKKKNLFREFESKKVKPEDADIPRYLKLVGSIFKDFTDAELVDKYFDEYCEDLNIELLENEIPDEMLGIVPGSVSISKEARDMFLEIYELTYDKHKKAMKLLDEFRKQTPDIPASYYLELIVLQDKGEKKYPKKLEEYVQKFPDYSLIKLLWLEDTFDSETENEEITTQDYNLDSIFDGRQCLHVEEMYLYLLFKLSVLARMGDPSRLEAFYYAYDDIALSEDQFKVLDGLVQIIKMQFVKMNINQ